MKLYHYLSSENALKNITQRRLKISTLDKLNDPFELSAAAYSNEQERVIWESWRKTQTKNYGLICFSKTWKNPVLWGHYADSHKGICLGFEVSNRVANEVMYTRNRLKIDIFKLEEQGKLSEAHMKKVFLTKFIDWKYEQEVRVLANLEKKNEDLGLYFREFDNDIRLTEIYIGPLCKETESSVSENLKVEESQVKIIKTRVAHKTFDVVAQDSKF